MKDLWNSQEAMENVGLWIAVYDMKKCEMVFTVCCLMHNMLLDVGMDQGFSNVQRVGCACPIGRDGLFIEGVRCKYFTQHSSC